MTALARVDAVPSRAAAPAPGVLCSLKLVEEDGARTAHMAGQQMKTATSTGNYDSQGTGHARTPRRPRTHSEREKIVST